MAERVWQSSADTVVPGFLLFPLLFYLDSQPRGWCHIHIQGKSFTLSKSSLEAPSETHLKMCFTNSGTSQSNQVIININHHTSIKNTSRFFMLNSMVMF
jgi:hypothetical protein